MPKAYPIIRPLTLVAAGTSVVGASSVCAAPLSAEGPSAVHHASSFADAGPGGKRLKRSKRGERVQALKQSQPERVEKRTTLYEKAASVEASDIQARLDTSEEAILTALANADTAAIADTANQIGLAAGKALEQAPGAYLSDGQAETLVAAAARAAEISEDEVSELITTGSLAIESYDGLDADAIAAQLNAIGNKALEFQAASAMAKRP
ncbi:MAG: hypothetical protein AAGH57_08250 [Pseudomonadota bacterium]